MSGATVGTPALSIAALILGAAMLCACASKKPAPRPLPPNVQRGPDGSCWYNPPVNCPPPPMTCEAPPPQRIACPQ
jgi:hypothetical protein